jgi:hypothetical protein
MENTFPPFTLRDFTGLEPVIKAAQTNAKVARVREDADNGVVYGTARAIQTKGGWFLGTDTDVREGYLWVTLRSGMETWWPVADLMTEARNGEFAIYDWK